MALFIQPSFAKGEIAPSLSGRVDTAAYAVALAKASNCVIHTYGGVSNRTGTLFIGPVKDHTYAPRFIPFEFKTSDKYLLEFGNLYMRVIRNDGYVTETTKVITGVTQANPAVVSSTAHGYSNGDEVYLDSVVGMVALNGNRYIVSAATANTFALTHQVDGTNIDSTGFTVYSSGGTSGRIYEITTPYITADLERLQYTQSADTMTLTHSSYPAKDLTRTNHAAWTISDISFVPSQDHPTGQTITVNTAGSDTVEYAVTAMKYQTGAESLTALNNTVITITGATVANPVVITATAHGFLDGDEVEINSVNGMIELNTRRFVVTNQTVNTFELMGTDGTTYAAYTSGGTVAQTFVRITTSATARDNTVAYTVVAGAAKYSIYRRDSGIWGLIGEATGTSFKDTNIVADTTEGPPIFNDPLSLPNEYPATSTYFEQRQVYGGSVNQPDTTQYSRTGDRKNLSAATPAVSDDAFSATLNSRQVNEILHYVPMNSLLVFTSGAEWKVGSGPDTAFELVSIRQKPQTFWGSSYLQPITSGDTIFYINESRSAVRSFGYSFQLDGYTGTNLGLLANHFLYDRQIVGWCIQTAPEVRFYMCRDDGKILTMTFDKEQEVIAWTSWETDGWYERAVSLRHTNVHNHDDVYFCVRRTIKGNTVRYLEKLSKRFKDKPENCYFVDCGLSLDIPITITGVTTTNPVVVTAPSHGLADGDEIDIDDIIWTPAIDVYLTETQPIQAIGRYRVANKTANTFELVSATSGLNIDGSTWNTYKSGGVVRLAVTSVRGLDHLEGETLVALANGNVIRSLVVSGGKVTFSRAFSRIHLGIPYISDIETLDINAPKGTFQGLKIKVSSVAVRFEASRGLLIGPSTSLLVEMKQREFERLGEPTQLLTGVKKITLKPSWSKTGKLTIRQKEPLNMTILSLVPSVEVGDV